MQFIAFDVETTGIVPGVDQIVEIGAVRFLEGKPESVFSTLINPGREIPSAASQINGITDDMVASKPTIDRLLDPFADFCKDSIIVAHNAPFDVQFLTADIKKHSSRSPRGVVLDTCAMARRIYPGLPNYKLGTLVHSLKIESSRFHRAEEDASYCGLLFLKMLEKMSLGFNAPIENLIALSGKKELRFPQIHRGPQQLSLL